MPRFRFELEALLTARRSAEREKQLAIAELERERRAEEDAIRRHQAFIIGGKDDMRGCLTGHLDLGSLRLNASETLNHVRSAQQRVLALAGVHRRIDVARAELVEAARSRRAIERLRERRFEAWRMDLEKREAAQLDELAVQAAARREDP